MNKYQDKVLGSMIGGAVGDALGYPVEFMSCSQIRHKFGSAGITRYILNKEGLAEISDDTQMSLFTANGVLFCFTRYACKGVLGATPVDYIRDSYVEWLQTQTGDINYTEQHWNWIREVKELHVQRMPGTTCISAIQQLVKHEEVQNNSKGCGGIMRVAPIPLFMANPYAERPDKEIVEIAMDVAGLTHKHPLGQLPAALLAYIIKRVLPHAYITDTQLCQYIHEGISLLEELYPEHQAHIDYMKQLLHKAITLTIDDKLGLNDRSDAESIALLGEGWVAEETLAIALYCILKYLEDFEKAIVASVNHSGDSDSTGAVTGNIMGALLGYDAIPDHYKEHLELRWLIEELAIDLASLIPVGEYIGCYDTPEKKRWMDKYVSGMERDRVPIKNSYLVHRELNIYAGEYPGDKEELDCRLKVETVARKCAYFYDLTTFRELAPYDFYLRDGKQKIHLENKQFDYYRFPIPNGGVPDSTTSVGRLLDDMIAKGRGATEEGNAIYIHCWGGVGRTGIIVACLYAYLLKGQGLSADEIYQKAMQNLNESFSRCPKSKYRTSPENDMQRAFIRQFIENECV